MKTVIRSVGLLLVSLAAFGQNLITDQLPKNFFAAGAGIRAGASKAGVSAICHQTGGLNYLCVESKFSGSTTANTVELKRVVLATHGVAVAINANAGLATGADGGTGGAFAVGGSALFSLARVKLPGYWIGASGAWDKRDVNDLVDAVRAGRVATSLRPFATSGTYYVFVGRSW